LVSIIRESSRRDYPKKSLSIKLAKKEKHDLCSVLGGDDLCGRSFILSASYDDRTYLRDALTFNRSRALGLWAPRLTHVELVSGSGAGAKNEGLYLLTERPDAGASGSSADITASFDPWDEVRHCCVGLELTPLADSSSTGGG